MQFWSKIQFSWSAPPFEVAKLKFSFSVSKYIKKTEKKLLIFSHQTTFLLDDILQCNYTAMLKHVYTYNFRRQFSKKLIPVLNFSFDFTLCFHSRYKLQPQIIKFFADTSRRLDRQSWYIPQQLFSINQGFQRNSVRYKAYILF